MSWDVMILNFDGPPIPPDRGQDYKPPPLGESPHVRELIARQLPEIDWSDPTWGYLEGDGFSIEFSIGRNDMVQAIMLHVRGGGDAVSVITRLCRACSWAAYDLSTDEYLDLENPSDEGWKTFQNYRDRVIGKSP